MQTSARGLNLIKSFEGLELKAYKDIAGVWTIGYGHTLGFLGINPTFHHASEITEAEAEKLLRQDLISREADLNSWRITQGVELRQPEFDALMSFIFNVGFTGFKGSTTARKLIHGDRDGAAAALMLWNKARVDGVLRPVKGLTRRRAAERDLFLSPSLPKPAVQNTSRLTPKPPGFWDCLKG